MRVFRPLTVPRVILVQFLALAGAGAIALGVLPQQGGNVDLLTQANVTLTGAAAGDQSGFSVSGAGDVNGDGISDVIIAAYRSDNNGRVDSGSSYVVYGSASLQDLDGQVAIRGVNPPRR